MEKKTDMMDNIKVHEKGHKLSMKTHFPEKNELFFKEKLEQNCTGRLG